MHHFCILTVWLFISLVSLGQGCPDGQGGNGVDPTADCSLCLNSYVSSNNATVCTKCEGATPLSNLRRTECVASCSTNEVEAHDGGCVCNSLSILKETGCSLCPTNQEPIFYHDRFIRIYQATNDAFVCTCNNRSFYSFESLSCVECPGIKFSNGNNGCGCYENMYDDGVNCVDCSKNGTLAVSGDTCECNSNFEKDSNGECLLCSEGFFYNAVSKNCESCQANASPDEGFSRCVCNSGFKYDSATNSCIQCPEKSTVSEDGFSCYCISDYVLNSQTNQCECVRTKVYNATTDTCDDCTDGKIAHPTDNTCVFIETVV